MMTITGLSHLFKWENLHNWWLTKYFFAPLYVFNIARIQYLLNTLHVLHLHKTVKKKKKKYNCYPNIVCH